MIFFSIILPCYNSNNTIERALKSIAIQTFTDYELIIIDDGSTDKTKDTIDIFLSITNLKFRYIYQNNQGAAKARHTGILNSHGKYIAFIDADDEWHYKKLELQYKYIKELNAKFFSTSYTYDKLPISTGAIIIKKYLFEDFLWKNRTSTPCTVLERALYEQVGGFDTSMRYSEDYNLWLKVSYLEPLYVLIEPPLVKLYKSAYGDSGLSAQLWRMEQGELYNYLILFKAKKINILTFAIVVIVSLFKYLKRIIITTFKSNTNHSFP